LGSGIPVFGFREVRVSRGWGPGFRVSGLGCQQWAGENNHSRSATTWFRGRVEVLGFGFWVLGLGFGKKP